MRAFDSSNNIKFTGVNLRPNGSWETRYYSSLKCMIYIGVYDTKEEAAKARDIAIFNDPFLTEQEKLNRYIYGEPTEVDLLDAPRAHTKKDLYMAAAIGKPILQSRFNGVYWNRSQSCWVSTHRYKGKNTHIGNFNKEDDAAKAFDIHLYNSSDLSPNKKELLYNFSAPTPADLLAPYKKRAYQGNRARNKTPKQPETIDDESSWSSLTQFHLLRGDTISPSVSLVGSDIDIDMVDVVAEEQEQAKRLKNGR